MIEYMKFLFLKILKISNI